MLPRSGEGAFLLVERHPSPSCRSADPPPPANRCPCPGHAIWRGSGPKGLLVRCGISQASASCTVAQPLPWHLGGLAAVPTAAPVSIPACGSAAFAQSSTGRGGFSPSYGNAAWLWGTWGWVGNWDFTSSASFPPSPPPAPLAVVANWGGGMQS